MSLKNAWAYIVRLCFLPKPTSQAYLTSRATDTGVPGSYHPASPRSALVPLFLRTGARPLEPLQNNCTRLSSVRASFSLSRQDSF